MKGFDPPPPRSCGFSLSLPFFPMDAFDIFLILLMPCQGPHTHLLVTSPFQHLCQTWANPFHRLHICTHNCTQNVPPWLGCVVPQRHPVRFLRWTGKQVSRKSSKCEGEDRLPYWKHVPESRPSSFGEIRDPAAKKSRTPF